ncbi:MAG: hypothetical protein B7X06_00180 [Verrucomicrobia bacterium 21-51-4]|nr:MAG: hypothetical protein B7X06_00180 [Verrucomicrobia bacterium 21-51-4]HQU08409.1 hypothetical protein [Opitutales bacterium]
MQLSESQKQTLTAWVQSGMTLHEIQEAIAREWQSTLTYLEARFLLDDNNLELQPKKEREAAAAQATPSEAADGHFDPVDATSAIPGRVHVTLSPVQRPDAVMSGTVTFSDGERAQWKLDQLGRLGLIPERTGYRPSQEDIADFQSELQSLAQQS